MLVCGLTSATKRLDRLSAPISWDDYFVALNKGLSGHMALDTGGYVMFLVVFGVAVGLAALSGSLNGTTRRVLAATVLGWFAALAHVLAFPLIADRLFVPAYAMSAVSLVVVVDRAVDYFAQQRAEEPQEASRDD